MPARTGPWPPNPLKEQILALLHQNKPPREIAAELGCSRNVVIGYRQRAGGAAAFGTATQPEKKQVAERRVNMPAMVLGGGRQLEDVQRGECLYPHGTPGLKGFHFCRHPQQPNSSYCPEHHAKCYVRMATRGEKSVNANPNFNPHGVGPLFINTAGVTEAA